jgi:fimbrial chaperone protein
MIRRALSRAACGLVLLSSGAGTASAGSFAVSPVRATLSASQPVGSLTVRNHGTEPAVVQLEVVSWAQQGANDVYTPTREVLATPPIFTLPAGGSQVVRVGLRRAPDQQRELTYRLYLQEVPPTPKPGFQGLQVALRLSVPVFVTPSSVASVPVLRWQATEIAPGNIKVSVVNAGNAHAQIANFKLAAADSSKHLVTRQAAAYVLPGQSRDWVVTTDAMQVPATLMQLSAQTDAGDIETEMMLEKP